MSRARSINLPALALCCVLCVLSGCAGTSKEPAVIVVRNGTDDVLALLRVQEQTSSPMNARRFGHFTSVPPRSNQLVNRRKDPPPLPADAVVVWQVAGGPELKQPINLAEVVRRTDIFGGVMVIEVRPDNTAHAYITARPE